MSSSQKTEHSSYKDSSKYRGPSGSGGGKKPSGWAGIQKGKGADYRSKINFVEWPIYVIGNVTFQWNHRPQSKEDEERTVATLVAYIAYPNDEPGIPASFKNYQPVWGIVKKRPHITDSDSTSIKIPDEQLHTTVKFSNQDDRDNSRGYTVHIYNDRNWQYDPSKYCTWDDRKPDDYVDQRVYYHRNEAPPTKYYTHPTNTSIQQSVSSAANSSYYTTPVTAQVSSSYSSGPASYSSGTGTAQSSSIYSSAPVSSGQSSYSSGPVSYSSGTGTAQSSVYSGPVSSTTSSSVYSSPVSSTLSSSVYSSGPVSSTISSSVYSSPVSSTPSSSVYSSGPVSSTMSSSVYSSPVSSMPSLLVYSSGPVSYTPSTGTASDGEWTWSSKYHRHYRHKANGTYEWS